MPLIRATTPLAIIAISHLPPAAPDRRAILVTRADGATTRDPDTRTATLFACATMNDAGVLEMIDWGYESAADLRATMGLGVTPVRPPLIDDPRFVVAVEGFAGDDGRAIDVVTADGRRTSNGDDAALYYLGARDADDVIRLADYGYPTADDAFDVLFEARAARLSPLTSDTPPP